MFSQPWQGAGDYDLFITLTEQEMRNLADFYQIDWNMLTTDPAKHLDDRYFCFASLSRKTLAIIPFLSIAFGGMYANLPMGNEKSKIAIDFEGELPMRFDIMRNLTILNPLEFTMEEFQFSTIQD